MNINNKADGAVPDRDKKQARKPKKNPYKAGDWVTLEVDVKDAYLEIWHHKGDMVQIMKVAEDGDGLMFDSDLGVHWHKVHKSSPPHSPPSGVGRFEK